MSVNTRTNVCTCTRHLAFATTDVERLSPPCPIHSGMSYGAPRTHGVEGPAPANRPMNTPVASTQDTNGPEFDRGFRAGVESVRVLLGMK
jgi:hypothetical protein